MGGDADLRKIMAINAVHQDTDVTGRRGRGSRGVKRRGHRRRREECS